MSWKENIKLWLVVVMAGQSTIFLLDLLVHYIDRGYHDIGASFYFFTFIHSTVTYFLGTGLFKIREYFRQKKKRKIENEIKEIGKDE